MTNMETDLPYLSRDPDRHGNPRIYVRRKGKRIRIKEPEGTLPLPRPMVLPSRSWTGQGPARVKAPPTHAKGTLGIWRRKILRLRRI